MAFLMSVYNHSVRTYSSGTSTPVSYAETRYAPCACSPLGKVERVSQPYAPGTSEANKVWTVYTYDALGRTLTGSNRACVTNCLYQANTVNVTDRAGRWKKQVFDAFGNLVQVVEQAESGDTRRLATRAKLGFPPEKRRGYQASEWASVSPVSAGAHVTNYTYTALGQMTRLTASGGTDLQYTYSATASPGLR